MRVYKEEHDAYTASLGAMTSSVVVNYVFSSYGANRPSICKLLKFFPEAWKEEDLVRQAQAASPFPPTPNMSPVLRKMALSLSSLLLLLGFGGDACVCGRLLLTACMPRHCNVFSRS